MTLRLSGKSAGPFALTLWLVVSSAGFMGLKLQADRIARARLPGSSIIYVPSGKFLKYATFGYSSLAADLLYLWAIQYYSTYEIPDRFTYLDHIFSVISELDPAYTDPYEVGSLIAGQEARNIPLALKILDRGLEKNPSAWIFPFEAGHIAQMQTKDYALAREYYAKAMALPGAPDLIKRLYANASFRTMDYRTSWDTWLEIYRTATDEQVRKTASNHLYQVKAAMDLDALKEAVAAFKTKFKRLPSGFGEIAGSGILTSIPKDMDGKDYLYDPATGEVKAATIPWKR
jgi:tetratricopeptide (TPR) repeat protein